MVLHGLDNASADRSGDNLPLYDEGTLALEQHQVDGSHCLPHLYHLPARQLAS